MLVNKQISKFAFTYPCPRKLREVVQMSLFERENKEKISSLWLEYHKDKYQNSANVLSKKDYSYLKAQLQTSPRFIWPIQRKGGHFILISEFQQQSIVFYFIQLFTYLEDYKKSGANATPYMVMTLFEELLFKKEIALMRSDILDLKLSREEANFLSHSLMNFYISPQIYEGFIHKFNHNQSQFDYDKYCKIFEIKQ